MNETEAEKEITVRALIHLCTLLYILSLSPFRSSLTLFSLLSLLGFHVFAVACNTDRVLPNEEINIYVYYGLWFHGERFE